MDQRVTKKVWRESPPTLEEDSIGAVGEDAPRTGPKLTFEDVCYVLFRHKWKIMFFALIGVLAAGFVYETSPKLYRSEAKLMVKYVTEMEMPAMGATEGSIRSPVLRGEAVVNSEVEILTSMDLALKVAEAVGPERVLAKAGGGNDLISAALVIHGGTVADVPRRGNVIRVLFQHPDATVVQPVLSSLLDQYLAKHVEIHRALGSLDRFTEQRAEVSQRLHETERNLWELKTTNGIFAVDESKRAAAEHVSRLQQALTDAETELAAREAGLAALKSLAPNLTNQASATPIVTEDDEERLERYRSLSAQLEHERRRRLEMLGQFTEKSPMVQPLQANIARLEREKRQMEQADPSLQRAALLNPRTSGPAPNSDYTDRAAITVLKAKTDWLRARLEQARADEGKLYALEAPILQLERTRDLEDAKYRLLSSALEQAQIGAGLGATPNISLFQRPSPPTRDIGALYKRVGVCAAGGLLVGLAVAVLMEFFVDQSVKRQVELRRLSPVPVLMSIPRTRRKRRTPLVHGGLNGNGGSKGAEQYLQPYVEALRDRILNQFETLARKPKLVGVCGCLPGAGVTSIAAGLASSLSESGDLKVLLVDMKRRQGRTHPMLGDRKTCTLTEALEGPKRQEALIAPNLYLASAGSGSQQVITSPRKFTSVVPQLNTSDYDYIVFDMPPVDQVSITPRLAKHMDLTLLVVEAEKAHRNTVRDAGSLLLEFTQNVAVVLNKTRSYLPKRFSQVG